MTLSVPASKCLDTRIDLGDDVDRMRLLVINSNRHRSPWPVPPVGACAVASAAAAAGHEVKFLDLCFVRRPEKAVARAAGEFRPDLVGISIRNFDNCDWASSRGFLQEIRDRIVRPLRAATHAPLVLGGGAAGLMPGEFLDYFGADFLLCGDGEPAIVGLLEALAAGRTPTDVPGITWRSSELPVRASWPRKTETTGRDGVRPSNDGAQSIHVSSPARAADLDALPLPYPERWLDLARYARWGGAVGIQTKRGCALECAYCAYNEIEGRCYRLKSMDRIAREITEALCGGARDIDFIDSTFNVPLDHALAVCHLLTERKFPARFTTMGLNPLTAGDELFAAMEAAGFVTITITAETGSPRMLESLRKGYTLADLQRTAARARRSPIPVAWDFLLGGPGETEETVRETWAFIDAHIPPEALVLLVGGVRLVAGSPMANQYLAARTGGRPATSSDLLQPTFYEPPIGRARLLEMIEARLRERPNHMALQDVEMPGWLLRGSKGLHKFLGMKTPMWRLVRPVRRVSNALGLPVHWVTRLARR
jgi:radical SAM superfamily enzyme YgiQ (UPF0313 family)